MSAAPLLSIVIPAYNEERRLPQTLDTIFAYLAHEPYAAEVIVADDGSDDRTAEIVTARAALFPTLRLLRLDHRGKGYAVRRGALAAAGTIVLLCDADLAVPIGEWQRLRAAIDAGADVAIGSREGAGSRREGEPFHRHVMGRAFNLLVRVIAVGGINDTQCGFKALRHAACQDLFGRVQIYGDTAPLVQGAAVTAYDVELLFLAARCGYRVAEVPVPWSYGEETKVSALRDSWRNLRDVLTVRYFALRGRYDLR